MTTPNQAEPQNEKPVFVKTRKAYVKTSKLSVTKAKEPPIRTDVKEPLTDEHRKEIRELITEWVHTSLLSKKTLTHGTAYSRLYEYGLEGKVNGIEQIEESEFETCRAFIRQRICIVEAGDYDGLTRRKSDWATRRITAIQSACRTNGISDEKRKAYMQWRWGVDSLLLMSDDQLEECRRYAVSKPPPKWNITKVEILGMQQLREKAFARWLDDREAEAKARGEDFDRQNIRIKGGKMAAIDELARDNKALFIDDDGMPMDMESFSKFLTKAKMGGFGGGRPRKPKI